MVILGKSTLLSIFFFFVYMLTQQAIQALPAGSDLLARHRTNIEDNFQMLKSTIADLHEFENSLPQEVEEW